MVNDPRALRILHVSDLHFGRPCRPEVVDAMESSLQATPYDVVVVSGDLSQRSLRGELQRAAAFLRDARRVAQVLVIPGNHDVAWWESPLHVRGTAPLYARYRRYVSDDLEPVLRHPAAAFIGVNTSHGVAPFTITKRLRDLSIVGAVTDAQLNRVAAECSATPPAAARVVVMHHNPVRGDLSRRFGITRPSTVLQAFARSGVDLILCGHDHQEQVAQLADHGGVVVCTAGTLSDRSRGGRPSSFFEIVLDATSIRVVTHAWSDARGVFESSTARCFERSSRGSV